MIWGAIDAPACLRFLADALSPDNPARACVPTPGEIADLVTTALPEFEPAGTTYAPGAGAAQRSVLVAFDRRAP